jgi:glycosyltransferase involved in cell wall biosynthesis
MEGISFMLRVRDEEKTLRKSIESLKSLTIPHEIVVILHLCKDASEDIAYALQNEQPNLRICKYENEVSRAGYENLATDTQSKHSLIQFYNWCLMQTRLPWIFKWDADFVATPELIEYLNSQIWTRKNARIQINAKNSTHDNYEYYLSDGIVSYGKYFFWEVPIYRCDQESIERKDIHIVHNSEVKDIKTYWSNPPWFETEDSDEARQVADRVQKLVQEFGEPPKGMARAGPMHGIFLHRIRQQMPAYVNFHT